MPIFKEKYYDDILWEAATVLVSSRVSQLLEKRGYQSLIMQKEQWNECVAKNYRRLARNYNSWLKQQGTSLSKVKISKKIKPEGGFTIVFTDKK